MRVKDTASLFNQNIMCYGVEIVLVYTHFPKCFPKILRKTIVQDWICDAQISVSQHMAENLYSDS